MSKTALILARPAQRVILLLYSALAIVLNIHALTPAYRVLSQPVDVHEINSMHIGHAGYLNHILLGLQD